MAASLVVVDHACLGLNMNGAPVAQYTFAAYLLGHIGVVAFFVVSGFIMMRQSSDRFGVPGSPLYFAWHRLIRIVPLYWIATILRFLSKLSWHLPTPHAKAQILLSLAFIPDFLSNKVNLPPILDVGWTLNYEMSFYLLFTLCLFLPRKAGVWLLILIPTLLPIFNRQVHSPIDHPLAAILSFYRDSMIRLFAFGVLLGFLELKARNIPRISLSISPAFLLPISGIIILAFHSTLGRQSFWVWAGLVGILVAVLCTGITLENPGWLNRFLVLLGDASYSTYLFHLWVNGWIVPKAILIYGHFHQTVKSPALVVILCVLAANLLGLLIHLAIERPITRALRRLPYAGAPATGSATLSPLSSTS